MNRWQIDDPRLCPVCTLPRQAWVNVPAAWVHQAPDPNSPHLTQFLYGEALRLAEDAKHAWIYAQSLRDDYCGYVSVAALSFTPAPQSNALLIRPAALHRSADMKSPVLMQLPLGSRLALSESCPPYRYLAAADAWIHEALTRPLHETHTNIVTVAKQYLNVPYLWGGRGAYGMDCSALVQEAASRCGVELPRDSDLQRRVLRDHRRAQAHGGDLLFLSGHVAIVRDETHVIHATAAEMQVCEEALRTLLERSREEAKKRNAAFFAEYAVLPHQLV